MGESEESSSSSDDTGVQIEYEEFYAALIFFGAVYVAGQISIRLLKMPALVGEIFAGLLLGPPLLDYAPYPEALVMLGEIGLVMMVVEAGINIDLDILKLVGTRGCLIAFLGSILPVSIGSSIAFALGNDVKASIAAGACFGPTSLGIATNILRGGNILNTPTGQLIIAAAIIDDMIALVTLSQLEGIANDDVTVLGVVVPVVSALGFLLIGGYLAIAVLPQYVTRFLDKYCSPDNRGFVATGMMFGLLYLMIPATYYSKSSYLMGAFISGLLFCSDDDVHHYFVDQYKRVMQWLVRIFFAASIGFQSEQLVESLRQYFHGSNLSLTYNILIILNKQYQFRTSEIVIYWGKVFYSLYALLASWLLVFLSQILLRILSSRAIIFVIV